MSKTKFITIAVIIYLIWILATYLLEGRINLLQKPSPLGRLTYAVIANMIIALFGVMNNINIESLLLHPIYPVITVIMVAIAAIVTLVLSDLLTIRKMKVNLDAASEPVTNQ